jgi:murein hydrolase activator
MRLFKYFLFSFTLLTPLLAQEKSEKLRELEKIRIEIEQNQTEASKVEASVKALGEDHAKLIAASQEAGEKARKFEGRLAQSELRILMLETNETGIRQSLYLKQDQLSDILASLQRMGVRPTPALLTSPDDTMKAIRSALLLAAVIPDMNKEAESLLTELNDLASVRKKSADERDIWTKDMASLHHERQTLEAVAKTRQEMLKIAEESLKDNKTRIAKLASEATSLEQFLKSLEPPPIKLNMPPQMKISPSLPFKELMGKLKWPVNGRITTAYGANDDVGITTKGVVLTTRPESLIIAPVDGQVVYAGAFRSYKQFIILNAGDGYHIIIAGAEKISVETGQYVVRGEPIAQMGRSNNLVTSLDKQVEPTLYMEFRKDGAPFNPVTWMTAQN